jgi:hypothetical protein
MTGEHISSNRFLDNWSGSLTIEATWDVTLSCWVSITLVFCSNTALHSPGPESSTKLLWKPGISQVPCQRRRSSEQGVFFRRNFRRYWSTLRSIAMLISRVVIPGRVPHSFKKLGATSEFLVPGGRHQGNSYWAPILSLSLNLNTVWHFLLIYCQMIYVLYVRKQTCDNYAENIRHDHTKLAALVTTSDRRIPVHQSHLLMQA